MTDTHDSYLQSDARQEAISAQKELFLRGLPVDTTVVSDFVLRSWQRSRLAGVDPETTVRKKVDETIFRHILAANADLLESSRVIMKELFSSLVSGAGSMILSTAECISLHMETSGRDGDTYPSSKPGMITTEQLRGTNGIGTCVAERRPIEIIGAEHYLTVGHRWSCSAAPIFDSKNQLIAVLNVSQLREKYYSHTLGMVRAAAYAISEQLRLRALLQQQQAIIELLDEGVIVVSRSGEVKLMNSKAASMLGLPAPQQGENIYKFMRPSQMLDNILTGDPHIMDQEAQFPLESGSLSCFFSAMSLTREACVVLTFREARRMRGFAARVAGSKAVYTFDRILGDSPPLMEVIDQAKTIARGNTTVLILGESGTGKELFAQSIHNASSRASRPFVAVNCGALPRNLVESELFGYEDGAFTGASRTGKPGKFELADGGTIFLDELGEMPMDAQVSLLRLLQNGEVTRIGGKSSRTVSVRVIAATNKNLEEAVRQHTFREDLYYRLNVFTLVLPPLRSRMSDIELLAEHFLLKFAGSLGKDVRGFTPGALALLRRYQWPGNIRELENVMERLANIVRHPLVSEEDLPPQMVTVRQPASPQGLLHSKEAETILETLRQTGGNIRAAAALLGVSRGGLYVKLRRLGIDVESCRGGEG
ncbi:sigma-54-dependent Fis family transcriptional regulator [Bilophila wadsworthia]